MKNILNYLNNKVLTLISFPVKECKTIEVKTNYVNYKLDGKYDISEERSLNAPAIPVWKKTGGDRYFFSLGTNWMIGNNDFLTTNGSPQHYFKGMYLLSKFNLARVECGCLSKGLKKCFILPCFV